MPESITADKEYVPCLILPGTVFRDHIPACADALKENIPVRVDLSLLPRNPPGIDQLLYDGLVMCQLQDPTIRDPVDPGVPDVDTQVSAAARDHCRKRRPALPVHLTIFSYLFVFINDQPVKAFDQRIIRDPLIYKERQLMVKPYRKCLYHLAAGDFPVSEPSHAVAYRCEH